ncbi:hypothetical protein, partial [Chloroflexus sp.]|uniref:hypothetical protein n=1 Tax=Chloroflexus sp. TaxID=1904827 RepID=UPI00404B92BC
MCSAQLAFHSVRSGSRFSVDTLADQHYPWRMVLSAAAMLPRQPYSRSGACHAIDPAGHEDAVCAVHNWRST